MFSGLGRIVSVAADRTSLMAELVEPDALLIYAPTTIALTGATALRRTEHLMAIIAGGGAAPGALELPLASGAPPVPARQQLRLECVNGGLAHEETVVAAERAAPGAEAWRISAPLTQVWPDGTEVSYLVEEEVARPEDLGLRIGDSIEIEFEGASGSYRATCLVVQGSHATGPPANGP